MLPKEIRVALSEGISSWLTFERHAGRDKLFSERYLALPIGQILQHCFGGKVSAESDHPILTTSGKSGRPPQLDFVVKDANDDVILAVESKWAAKSKVAIADVLWDCVRLELAAEHYKCDALFILAGTREQVDTVLQSKSFVTKNAKMQPTYVLNLHGLGKSSVKINSFKDAYIVALHKLLRAYPLVKFPSELVSGSGTQVPKLASPDSYTAVVWNIAPAETGKRRLFIPLSQRGTVAGQKAMLASIKKRIASRKAYEKKNAKKAASVAGEEHLSGSEQTVSSEKWTRTEQ